MNIQEINKFRSDELILRLSKIKYSQKQALVTGNFKKVKHVVYVLTHVGVCGGVKIILQHANNLLKEGIRVSLVSHFPKPEWFKIECNYIEVPFEEILAAGIPPCDIIIATYWDHIQECIDEKIAPVVYFEQGDFHLYDREGIDKNIDNFIKIQYSLSNFIMTVSNETAKYIRDIFERESKICHNAIDTNVFNTTGKRYINSNKYILMIGSMEAKFKGIDDIIKAYKLLKNKGFNYDLIWITPNTPSIEYKEVTKIFVNPPQHTIGELYRGASMYVSGSYYESFPLPPLEAMACGCPVISTKNIGILEYGKDNDNILFCEIENPMDMSEKIEKLIGDDKLRLRIREGGIETAKKFRWENIIKDLIEYYEYVASFEIVKSKDNKSLYPQEHWDKVWENINISIASSNDIICRWIDSFIPNVKEKTCFEIGCYPGRYLGYLGAKGYKINGVDLTPKTKILADVLSSKGIEVGEIYNEDFFSMDIDSIKYDLVCSFGFIEHFTQWIDVVVKQCEMVNEGGFVVIECPNFSGIVNKFLRVVLDNDNFNGHNTKSMHPEIWKYILTKFGFEIIFSGYIGEFDFWLDYPPSSKNKNDLVNMLMSVRSYIRKSNFSEEMISPYCGIIAKRSKNVDIKEISNSNAFIENLNYFIEEIYGNDSRENEYLETLYRKLYNFINE